MYDAIVVGSGFGGAVSACRLAQAGLSVAIIERGKRYPVDSFPRFHDPLEKWLYDGSSEGLFDVKPIEEMFVVEAAGYGGGSLIYANVHLRCPSDVFQHGWPAEYSRAELDPYYDLVAYMLDIKPIERRDWGNGKPAAYPPKTVAMQKLAGDLGRNKQFVLPNLAVTFGSGAAGGATGVPKDNKFKVPQTDCTHCGECVIGCQKHAKNTLDLNYLAVAEQNKAVVLSQCEVTNIVPQADGTYEVQWKNAVTGASESARARTVFLCAGAINTTTLLLRCRDQHHSLPHLSAELGTRYSGNGDFLGFSFDTKGGFDPSQGPTITSGIVYDVPDAQTGPTWFILEEGGYPKELARLIQVMNPKVESAFPEWALHDEIREITKAKADQHIPGEIIDDNTAVFLSMGRDRANGRIELAWPNDSIRIIWDVPDNALLYDTESRLNTDVSGSLGGNIAFPPTWKLLHQPISVHNLGGCVMADSEAGGVIDSNGEVFNYRGLYVMDGAALPSSTGVNPSHTIAAVAERNVENAIRRLKNDPTWQAPERSIAPKIIDPLDGLIMPSAPPQTESVGVRFNEKMRGFLRRAPFAGKPEVADYQAAFEAAKASGDAAEVTLKITVPDLDRFLADTNHTAIAQGTVAMHENARGVKNGVFNLFSPGDLPDARRMLYALPFWGTDGKRYLLDGYKDVRHQAGFDVLAATTTLYTAIREGHSRKGNIVALGILTIDDGGIAALIESMEVTGTHGIFARAEALLKFGKMFLGTLWALFVRPRI